jgi:hypothetical protein
MSPNAAMSEDERRDLIARQHRALYGAESNIYTNDASSPRPLPQDTRVGPGNVPAGFRGSSPYDPFGMQSGGPGSAPGSTVVKGQGNEKDGTAPGQRSRANSTSSPASNQNASYGLYDSQQQQPQQSSRTSTSSPGGSPPGNAKPPTSNAGNVAPIGTRPTQQPVGPQSGGIQKRSTTPLPSPLSYGFSADQGQSENPSTTQEEKMNNNLRGAWGNSGVWGGKGGLGVQAKVWG